jgi:hypothetical protein
MLQGGAPLQSCNCASSDVVETFATLEFPEGRPISGSAQNATIAETFTKFHRNDFHNMASLSRSPCRARLCREHLES